MEKSLGAAVNRSCRLCNYCDFSPVILRNFVDFVAKVYGEVKMTAVYLRYYQFERAKLFGAVILKQEEYD